MIELAARHATRKPVRLRLIAEHHAIPQRFLVQILLQLKSAGLVVSVRGAAGGYRLAKPPGRISLGDVIKAIDGNSRNPANPSTHRSPAGKVLEHIWREVDRTLTETLAAISLSDLLEQARKEDENMYYI